MLPGHNGLVWRIAPHQQVTRAESDNVAAVEDMRRRAEMLTPFDLAQDDELCVAVEKLTYELEGLTAAAQALDRLRTT